MKSDNNENFYLNKLVKSINNYVENFNGVAGVSIKDLSTNWYLGINDDLIFPTASSIKIPILLKLIESSEDSKLDLLKNIEITEKMKSRGSGVIHKMNGTINLTIENLAILMINLSDNTATNLCIDIAGQDDVNKMLEDYEFKSMRLNRKMQDYTAIKEGRENLSSVKEMNLILEMLDSSNAIKPEVAKKVLNILSLNKSTPISQPLPENIIVAGKTGGMPGVRCETAIIYLTNRKYILTVMTSYGGNGSSPSKQSTGEHNGSDLISEISLQTYKYFNVLDQSSKFGQGLTQTVNH
jgi:beta-lactamase class A|tara:strand:+ start:1832 stop:2719 length:888 start_codon:yes stop_codon:yes gene_type:complete